MNELNKQNKQNKVENGEVKYFYYYMNTNEMKLVNKKAFLKGDWPVIGKEDSKIKIVGLTAGSNKKRLKYLLHATDKFKNEGLLQDCFDASAFFCDCVKIMAKLKRLSDDAKKLFDFKSLLQILSIFLRLQNIAKEGFNMSDIISVIIDVYSATTSCLDRFKPQMLEELCLSTVSMFLPKTLFEIIKRMNVFSSAKLCDDISGIHQLLSLVVKAVCFIIDLLPTSIFVTNIKKYLESLCDWSVHTQLYQMSKFISEEKIGERIIKHSYRVKIKEFNKTLNHGSFRQWCRKSAAVLAIYLDFQKLCKRIEAFEQCSRQEPIGIVFQGPPGCGKSRAMNAIVQSCPWSKYVHVIKDVNDGKDFYDMYENETIFYMDDVGQQGISQWRTFINMISEVKYPLDCARAENKDTKFFNSEIILATTNEFMNLSGLVRTDGIRELPALWRRCVVLDFSRVKFDGKYSGVASWKSFNLDQSKFEDGFPKHFACEEEFKGVPTAFSFSDKNDDLNFYGWCCRVIKAFRDVNSKRLVSNNLSDSQLDLIRETSGFASEGIFDWTFTSSLITPAPVNVLWDDDPSGLSDNDLEIDPQELNKRLQELKEELNIEPDILYRNPILSFISDTTAWITKKISSALDSILASEEMLSVAIYVVLIAVVMAIRLVIEGYSKRNKAISSINKYSVESLLGSKFDSSSLGTYHQSLVNNLREVTVLDSSGHKIHVIGLFSGHCVVLPSHAVLSSEDVRLIVYKNKEKNHIIYDKIKISVVYLNRAEDLCVVKLPANLPTVFRKIAAFGNDVEGRLCLLSPFGKFDSCSVKNISATSPIVYSLPMLKNVEVSVSGPNFSYEVHGDGLCGAIVCNNYGVLGMHVAGNEKQGLGLAIRWSDNARKTVNTIIQSDCEIIPFEMSAKEFENVSVLKLQDSLNVSVGSKSNLSSTPLFGIYPVSRFPANLTKFGNCTVKDIAKKSFQHTVIVPASDLEFGKAVVRRFLSDSKFRLLSDFEIVKGNEMLAGLNKDSSTGFGCDKDKTKYINFEEGALTDVFIKELDEFCDGFVNRNDLDWKKLVWCEALKDELRNEEKEGVPRSFRVGTIHHQVLMKRYFGWLVEHLMANRKYNNICVGINPVKEWPTMYEELKKCKGVFAGDIAKWDGSMNNMVQDAIKEVILEFVPAEHVKIIELLLDNAIRSIVAVQDDLYVTTHSMPSGHYLTAILNSLVNRFYTAMWYNREIGDHNVNKFLHLIVDYVYGDDKLLGIKDDTERLNALTMKKFFEQMGMGFTDSLKNDICVPFQSIEEVTFLKRYFRFHDILGRVTCPLELRTLQSGLSFYDCTKDLGVVLQAKIETYQREAYLWPERDEILADFAIKLKERGYGEYILSRGYLRSVYENPDEYLKELSWGNSKYL